jgi:hypothetical protein
VPASSPKFLKSSLSSPSQTVTYDLEDSVHASAKASARQSLIEWLEQIPADGIQGKGLDGLSIAVRPNSPFTAPEEEEPLGEADIGKAQQRETLREKSESAREENVGVQDIMRVWGSKGARRINDGAGPMMLLPKASRRKCLNGHIPGTDHSALSAVVRVAAGGPSVDDDRDRSYDRFDAWKTPQVSSFSSHPAEEVRADNFSCSFQTSPSQDPADCVNRVSRGTHEHRDVGELAWERCRVSRSDGTYLSIRYFDCLDTVVV